MRGLSGRNDTGTFATRVIHETASRKRNNTPTGKMIDALHKAFDSLSFDEREFAFLFSLSPTRIQRRFIDCIVQYFAVLAERADSGLWVDEDDKMIVLDGKMIHDSLRFLND